MSSILLLSSFSCCSPFIWNNTVVHTRRSAWLHNIPHCRLRNISQNLRTTAVGQIILKLGTESVVIHPIRLIDFYAGSREWFSSQVSGRYKNTGCSHLLSCTSLFSRGWTRWFKSDRGWERVREREATGCRERRNRMCVGKREADKSSMPWREIVEHAGRLCS